MSRNVFEYKFMTGKYIDCLTITALVLLLLASQASAQVCTTPPADLVAWWPGGGDAKDIVGTNDGTPQNGAAFAAGKVGQAFSFDGSDDFVLVPDAPNLAGFPAVTVEAWVRSSSPADQDIVAHFDILNPHAGFLLGIASSALHFYVADDTTYSSRSSLGTITDGVFHHVAVTYDSQTVNFYIDGVLDTTHTFAAPVVMGDPTTALHIGTDTNALPGPVDGPLRYFDGLIDELAIFGRVLSAAEIADIHSADSAGKCQLPPSSSTPEMTSASYRVRGANFNSGGMPFMVSTASVPLIGGSGTTLGQSGTVGFKGSQVALTTEVGGLWPVVAGGFPNLDVDIDSIQSFRDNCRFDANTDQLDSDIDGVGDLCDNCQWDVNPEQLDFDEDSMGDVCDSDDDGDGLSDAVETGTGVFISLIDTGTDPLSFDSDGDGFGDGEEVAAGSDPNDSGSVPAVVLVPALGLWMRGLAVLSLLVSATVLSRTASVSRGSATTRSCDEKWRR